MSKKERLDKILSNMGYGSRREIKEYAKEGRIKVNAEIAKDSSLKVDPYADLISFDGEKLKYTKYIYLMMNKPDGITSSTDDHFNETVIDIIDSKYRAFSPFPVGRLDKDTEGLLILTNDGQLAHELLSPRKHVDKTYYVEVDGYVDESYKEVFSSGIVLGDGYKTMPAKLEILESNFISKVKLTIREGKFHQVKRMFQAIGMEVLYLKRISMGELFLDDTLSSGDYRELSEDELMILKNKGKKVQD